MVNGRSKLCQAKARLVASPTLQATAHLQPALHADGRWEVAVKVSSTLLV